MPYADAIGVTPVCSAATGSWLTAGGLGSVGLLNNLRRRWIDAPKSLR